MKKIYLVAAMAGLVVNATAQEAPATLQKAFMQNVKEKVGQPTTDKSAVIFSEDFANGLDGNNELMLPWTISQADDLAKFEHDLDGPEGTYTQATQNIQSTTVANGSMMLNGDKVNSNADYTAIDMKVSNIEAYLESPAMSLPSREYAIEFQHRFRWCCSADPSYFMEFSFDGGTTWEADSYPIVVVEGANDLSPTLTESLFLGCFIEEGQDLSNFKFRFAHIGQGSTSHYFWAIDDVKVVDLNAASTRTVAGYHGDIVNDWDYEQIALEQAHELVMGAHFSNVGSNSINDFGAKIEVSMGGSPVNTTSPVLTTFDICLDSTVWRPTFTPDAIGTYDVEYTPDYAGFSNDINQMDDTLTSRFEVTDGVFAHGSAWRGGSYQFTDDDGLYREVEYGMIYRAYENSTAYAIRTMFVSAGTRTTSPDQFLTVQLYQYLDPADPDNDAMELVAEGELELPASFITNSTANQLWNDIVFSSPVALEAGELYFASIAAPGGGPSEAIAIPTHGDDNDNAARAFGDLNGTGTPSWFGLASGLTVGLVLNPDVIGVGALTVDADFGLLQNVPNPVASNTTIGYELKKAGKVELTISDITGKVVAVINEGTQGPGAHTIDFDASQLANGIYTYTLDVNGARQTNRMVVSK